MTMQKCPHCGHALKLYRNPVPTVDIIIYEPQKGIALVLRAHEPIGWALPGGFVEYGETLENAAVREAQEETGLVTELEGLVGVYSDPARDSRQHTITTVFHARAKNPDQICGADDAAQARFFPVDILPPLVFDHERIVADFLNKQAQGPKTLSPRPGASVCIAAPALAHRNQSTK